MKWHVLLVGGIGGVAAARAHIEDQRLVAKESHAAVRQGAAVTHTQRRLAKNDCLAVLFFFGDPS